MVKVAERKRDATKELVNAEEVSVKDGEHNLSCVPLGRDPSEAKIKVFEQKMSNLQFTLLHPFYRIRCLLHHGCLKLLLPKPNCDERVIGAILSLDF